ncbi:hypothetical protein FOCC_FOCC014193 [Frankliniella occidentalis]|nr:hypothetical protein FOCC_FOCC014193 [Frankliniella occidentalis]
MQSSSDRPLRGICLHRFYGNVNVVDSDDSSISVDDIMEDLIIPETSHSSISSDVSTSQTAQCNIPAASIQMIPQVCSSNVEQSSKRPAAAALIPAVPTKKQKCELSTKKTASKPNKNRVLSKASHSREKSKLTLNPPKKKKNAKSERDLDDEPLSSLLKQVNSESNKPKKGKKLKSVIESKAPPSQKRTDSTTPAANPQKKKKINKTPAACTETNIKDGPSCTLGKPVNSKSKPNNSKTEVPSKVLPNKKEKAVTTPAPIPQKEKQIISTPATCTETHFNNGSLSNVDKPVNSKPNKSKKSNTVVTFKAPQSQNNSTPAPNPQKEKMINNTPATCTETNFKVGLLSNLDEQVNSQSSKPNNSKAEAPSKAIPSKKEKDDTTPSPNPQKEKRIINSPATCSETSPNDGPLSNLATPENSELTKSDKELSPKMQLIEKEIHSMAASELNGVVTSPCDSSIPLDLSQTSSGEPLPFHNESMAVSFLAHNQTPKAAEIPAPLREVSLTNDENKVTIFPGTSSTNPLF